MKYTIKLEFQGPVEIKAVVDRWVHAIKKIRLGSPLPNITIMSEDITPVDEG